MMFKKILFAMVCTMALAFAAEAADFSKIPNPMESIKEGQWVTYKTMGGTKQKQSVTAVTERDGDTFITLKIEMFMGDTALASEEKEFSTKEAKAMQEQAWKEDPDAKITEEKITIDGKTYDGVVIEASAEGASVKIYMSKDVPVTGMLKMEMTGMPEPLLVLEDFGS